jgi:hypothetical protein
MIRNLAGVLAFATLAACASAPDGDDLAAYPAALVGRYDNAAQYAAAPADLKRPPVADDSYDWIDRQTAIFTPVAAPALGPHVLYVEWRGADGVISRQRLWAFRRDDTGAVRMDFYTLAQPERFAGAAPGDFAALTAADLIGYGPACGLQVSRAGAGAWDARIDPETCRIVARSGRAMGIDARITVMPTGVLYQEAGILEDGRYAFRVPGGTPYDFRRLP